MSSQLAVTERGTRLKNYTEDDVDLALRVLILTGGSVKETIDSLKEEGIAIKADALRYWRDVAFNRRYAELRNELSQEVGDELAGRAMERAMEADSVEQKYIQRAGMVVDLVAPDKVAKAALDLAKLKGENITKSQLLRNKPTEIRETRDIGELLDILKAEGLLAKEDDPRTVTAEAVEIE